MQSFLGSELTLLGMGIGLGALHTLSPDHWIAMLPITMDARERGWRVGLQWGFGHALGLTSVGIAAYAVRDWLDLAVVGEAWTHWLLAGVLVAVGIWGLLHVRSEGHEHARPLAGDPAQGPEHGHAHTVMAFGVGAVHGVSGTGAFLAVVPTLGLDSWAEVWTYILAFGVGTVGVMVGFSAALGIFARRISSDPRFEARYRRGFEAACWLAIAAGVVWVALPEPPHLH